MFNLPVASKPQPFSPQTAAKSSRLRGATVTEGVCPYCAVGCGQLIYTKGGQLIDIEGDPRSPINEGTLCPKGANSFQLATNPHRIKQVLYRAPYSDRWEPKPLDCQTKKEPSPCPVRIVAGESLARHPPGRFCESKTSRTAFSRRTSSR